MTPSQRRSPNAPSLRAQGFAKPALRQAGVGRRIHAKVLKSLISRKEKEASAARFRRFWQSFQARKSAFPGEKRRSLLLGCVDLTLGLGEVHDDLA